MFDKQAFKDYAKENLVLVELDFPRDRSKITKEQYAYNRTQAKEYGIRGYPTVFVLDANGKAAQESGLRSQLSRGLYQNAQGRKVPIAHSYSPARPTTGRAFFMWPLDPSEPRS